MFKKVTFLALLAAIAALALAATSSARGGDAITKAGVCTGSSTSQLKAKVDDAGIEVEWEVDSNVVGQQWTWRLADNGSVVAKGRSTTQAPSGSFTVRRVIANQPGADKIRATAKNAATGETCHAALSI